MKNQTADHAASMITAGAGRIDSSSEKSELVLKDAMQTTVPVPAARDQSYVVERLETLRITFPTGRSTLIAKLQKPDANPDEMGFSDLRQFVAGSTGIEHREASIIFHKRLAFAMAPF